MASKTNFSIFASHFALILIANIGAKSDSVWIGGDSTNLLRVPNTIEQVPGSQNISEPCRSQLLTLNKAMGNPTSIHMFDAWAKVPSGIKNGNFYWPGSYSLCLELGKSSNARFDGKYCQIRVKSNLSSQFTPAEVKNFPFILGVCVPSTCSDTDLAFYFYSDDQTSVLLNPSSCKTADNPLDLAAWITILVLIGIGLLLLFSTIYDVTGKDTEQETNNFGKKFLMCFSMKRNSASLLSLQDMPGSLDALHGMRVFSMFWIVLFHCYRYLTFSPTTVANSVDYMNTFQDPLMSIISNGALSVDTFFFLSGLLVCYTFHNNQKKNKGKFNLFYFYLHRYLRLTPVFMMMTLVSATLLNHIASGPINKYTVKSCQANWWVNLLYLNNIVNLDQRCLGHTWYLSCDMQLFILSPLILYPLYRWRKQGYCLLAFCLFTTVGVSMFLTYNYDVSIALVSKMYIENPMAGISYNWHYYLKPYPHAPVYIVGVFMGDWIARNKGKSNNLSKKTLGLGWLICTVLALANIFGAHSAISGEFPSLLYRLLYNGLHTFFWGLSLAWITFTCITGQAGFVNNILTYRAILPLSRLSYSVYIGHILVLFAYYAEHDVVLYFSQFLWVLLFFGILVFSCLLAFLMSLAFELPFLNMDKLLQKFIKQ